MKKKPNKLKMRNRKQDGVRLIINYRPEVHEGKDNKDNEAFAYEVLVHEPFENIKNLESFAGFSGVTENGEWKRFRLNRVISMVQVN